MFVLWVAFNVVAVLIVFNFRRARNGESFLQSRDTLVAVGMSIAGLVFIAAAVDSIEEVGFASEPLLLLTLGACFLMMAPVILKQLKRRAHLLQAGVPTVGEVLGPIRGHRGLRGVVYAFVGPDGVRRRGEVVNLTSDVVNKTVATGKVVVVFDPANPNEHEGDVFGTRAAEVGLLSSDSPTSDV